MKKWTIILLCLCVAMILPHLYRGAAMPKNKVALGRQLFFDTILSSSQNISCASCHKPAYAFADTSSVSLGVFGSKGTRNTLSARQ